MEGYEAGLDWVWGRIRGPDWRDLALAGDSPELSIVVNSGAKKPTRLSHPQAEITHITEYCNCTSPILAPI